jgi:hypothetical protein
MRPLNRLRSAFVFALTAYTISCFTLRSVAHAERSVYISTLLGISGTANGPFPTPVDMGYGLRLGMALDDHLAFGFHWQRAVSNPSYRASAQSTVPNSLIIFDSMAELTFFLDGYQRDTWWGGLLGGLKTVDYNIDNVGRSKFSDFTYGFSVGYLFYLRSNFTMSPQITVVHADSPSFTNTQISGLLNLSIWF